ncbi:MAG: hypothetical protein WCS93_05585 [Candidatus Delongbacteria bacterium]
MIICLATALLSKEDEDIAGRIFRRYSLADTLGTDTLSQKFIPERKEDNSGQLYKNGVIYRGISFKGSSGTGMISGLNLELQGKISENMEISAFISDDNMAVSGEGSTESLKDIENIYIQFRHPRFMSRMGNFSVDYNSGEYGKLASSLSGALLNVNSGGYTAEGFVSAGRTEYSTMEFKGIEGISGPYLILRSGNEFEIEAGSETVWINGIKLDRGTDYYFDNLTAELHFLPGTPVHEADRIIIDFRYSEEDYNNITYGFDTKADLLGQKVKIGLNYYETEDIKNKPLSFDMTDEISQMLQNSDSERIYISGAELTPDEGDYDLVEPDSIFVYRGSGNGDYTVRFSYFETGGEYNIDYDSTGTSFFVHDAINGGKYLPLIEIDAPDSYSRLHLSGSLTSGGFSFYSELAASGTNENIYNHRSTDFKGLGDREEISFSAESRNMGEFKLYLNRKFYNKELVLPSRLKEVRENEDIDDTGMISAGDYLKYGFGLDHRYKDNFDNKYNGYYIEKGVSFFETGHQFSSYGRAGKYFYKSEIDFSEAENDSTVKEKTAFFINPGFSGDLWSFGPYYKKIDSSDLVSGEKREDTSVKIGNFSGFSARNVSVKHNFEYGNEDKELNGVLKRYTNTVKLENRIGTILSTDAVWTNVRTDDRDSADVNYNLINFRMNFNKDGRYRIFGEYGAENSRYYRKIRTYYKVDEGTGDYIFADGEYYPDDFGNYSYFVSQEDDPSKITGVRLSIKSFFDMKETENRRNILYWLSRFDIEQDVEITEKSRTERPNDILLLNISTFQQDSTVSGLIESKTILHFLRNRKLSADYSYLYRQNLYREFINYSDNTLLRAQNTSLKIINGKFTHRLSGRYERSERNGFNEIKLDDVLKKYVSYSVRHNIKPYFTWSSEFEFGKEHEVVRNLRTESYRLSPGMSVGISEYGILRTAVDIIKIDSSRNTPYSMNSGYGVGMSYKWKADADYRFSNSVLGNLSYSGRYLSYDSNPYHELRIEFRMEL